MKFNTTNRADLVNILVLIEAVTMGIKIEEVDVYDYLNYTDIELIEMLNAESTKLHINI